MPKNVNFLEACVAVLSIQHGQIEYNTQPLTRHFYNGGTYQAYQIHTVACYICNSGYRLTGGADSATCTGLYWTGPGPECVYGEFLLNKSTKMYKIS